MNRFYVAFLWVILSSFHSLEGSDLKCPEQTSPFQHGSVTEYPYKPQMIDYECYEGYKLVGVSKQICGDDGTWQPSERPQCLLINPPDVKCPEQDSPFNHGSLTEYHFKRQMIDYKCHIGYKMIGASRQVCEDDGLWHPADRPHCIPTATAVRSGAVCTSPLHMPNADLRYNSDSWPQRAGDTATVICKPEYTTSDSNYKESYKIRCSQAGVWTMMNGKTILAQCALKRCPIPPTIPNAHYSYSSFAPLMGEGSRVKYKCFMGYKTVDKNATNLLCQDGEWVGPIPKCVRSQFCPMPKSIPFGYWDSLGTTKYEVGARVRYYCNSGYRLVGSQVLECLNSQEWSSIPPMCLLSSERTFYCPTIGNIENGYCKCHEENSHDLQQCKPFYRGVKVDCRCNQGYRLDGETILTCTHSNDVELGSWDYDQPFCVKEGGIDSVSANTYSTGEITDGKNHVSTLVIVIATACSVLGVLLLIMVIVVFRRRKPRPHLFHPGMTPPPYARVHSGSMDEHDRLALMAYADQTRMHLPSYEEATAGHCSQNAGNNPQQLAQQPSDYRPLPSIPPALRTNTTPQAQGENTNRHSTVTTSTMNRDGTSEIFGSLDTVNVSMSDASTSVTVETYDSGTSTRSASSQQARAGSLTSSDDNLANDDAPLLDNTGQTISNSSSDCSIQSQEHKED